MDQTTWSLPRSPPIEEYIAAVEQTCQNLIQGRGWWGESWNKSCHKESNPPRPSISREEQRDLRELKKDGTRVILTADKGVCLVVMDKEEYIGKAEELLKEKTYKIIPTDPTNRQKSKLIQILKKDQRRRRDEWINIQNDISNRCWYSKILWITKDPQGWGTTKTHCIQQGVSFLQHSKGTWPGS